VYFLVCYEPLNDNQIKGTIGITESLKPSDHSDVFSCHLDVDLIIS